MKKILFSSIAGVCFLFGINTTFAADSLPKKMEEVACSTMQSFFTDGGVSLQPNDQCFVMSGNQKIYTGYKIGNLGDYYINQSQTDEHYVFESTPTGVQGLQIKRTPLQGEWKIDNNGDIFRWATTQETGVERKVANINGQSVYFRVYPANTTHLMVRSEDTQGIHLTNVTPNMNPNLPAYRITYVTNSYVIRDGKFQGPTTHQEHAFYYAAWCGDGVVDTAYGEVYDDGVNNGKPGYASTDCKTKTDTPKPGVCDGTSAGVATYTAPTTNLCKTGTPSVVRDVGTKFTWTCNGVDGGTNTACEAPKKQSISGVCDGASNGIPTINPPTTNLCKTGTASTPVLDNTGTKYEWTCNGEGTGGNATCEAPKKSDDPKSYCGDGVVQTGESCDLGSNNGKPVNGVIACDTTCNTPKTPKVCDQTFSGSLYVGQAVTFYDAYTNHNTFPHTLNSFQVDFIESDDMNKDGKTTFAEHFQWSSPYKNGSQIPVGAKDVKVISANMAYRILQAPKVRKSDNISINYSINISTPNGTSSHKECINYEVAWCGDGVIDTKYGETCDPADLTKKNWGSNGCNTAGTISNDGKNISCQPKEGASLDLSIKKFIDQDDAQPGNAIEKNANDTFNYVIKVKVESGKTSGTTTVRDILPTGIGLVGSATGDGWTCAFNPINRLFECTSTAIVDTGKYFTDITVPVKILSAKGEVRNDATVHNPNEKPNSCYTDNRMPSGSEQSCQKDSKNTDPAVVKVLAKNDLSIKKYAGDKDGQVLSDALSVDYGKGFTYKYVITASGSTDQKNVTVTDKFPLGVKVTGFDKVPANWTCKNGQVTDSGKVHHTAICNTPTFVKNTSVEIIVKVQLVSETEFKNLNLPLGVFTEGLRNIAYVCSEEVTSTNPITGTTQTKVCDSECTDPNDPKCLPPPPPPECSPIPGDPHYDPACVKIQKLEIKKYVQGKDAQTAADQVPVNPGEEFEYTFEVKNTAPVDATGAKVEDVFPSTIEVVKTGAGTDWTCTQNGQTMTCFYNKTIEAGAVAPTIKAIVKTNTTAKQDVSIRNVAAVCEFDSTKPANNENCTPNPTECKPGDINYNPTTKICDPATVVIDGSKDKLDLSIKKYIGQDDAQSAIFKNTNDTFNYVLKVKVESGKATGITTVKDVLPTGVELNGTATGTNWIISWNGKTLTAESTQVVSAGNYFADIIVPVRVTAGKGTTVRNDATVYNPNEKPNSCYTDNRMPSGSEQSCQQDSKNTDPAIFKISDDREPPRGYCGDGILSSQEKKDGKTCDIGTNNGVAFPTVGHPEGIVLCDANCKSDTSTNPGEISENFYISIPAFAKTIGYSSVGSRTGLFQNNGMVVGKNTNIFALSDTIVFKYKNEYNIARSFDAGKEFQIRTASGKDNRANYLIGNSVSKSISNFGLPSYTLVTEELTKIFYVIGEAGDRIAIPETAYDIKGLTCKNESLPTGYTFETKKPKATGIVRLCTIDAGFETSSKVLFNGAELANIKSQGLAHERNDFDYVMIGTENVADLAKFQVTVLDRQVAAAGATVNRAVRVFENFSASIENLKNTLKGNTTNTTTINNDSFPFGNTTTSVTPMNSGITKIAKDDVTITSLSELEKYKHNGNPNVYSVRFEKPGKTLAIIANDLKLAGVKTLIVENGDIVFKGNTSYQNADASWAFIAKNGNIIVNSKVTNLSGVFLSVKEGANTGEIRGSAATDGILRIEGSLYGNAQPLFNSRTYARGTNSYDIVTAGTILNYSNRALRNPPPMLSNYLNHYKVQRVVR